MMKFAKSSVQFSAPCLTGQGEALTSCTGTDRLSMIPPHIQTWLGGCWPIWVDVASPGLPLNESATCCGSDGTVKQLGVALVNTGQFAGRRSLQSSAELPSRFASWRPLCVLLYFVTKS